MGLNISQIMRETLICIKDQWLDVAKRILKKKCLFINEKVNPWHHPFSDNPSSCKRFFVAAKIWGWRLFNFLRPFPRVAIWSFKMQHKLITIKASIFTTACYCSWTFVERWRILNIRPLKNQPLRRRCWLSVGWWPSFPLLAILTENLLMAIQPLFANGHHTDGHQAIINGRPFQLLFY